MTEPEFKKLLQGVSYKDGYVFSYRVDGEHIYLEVTNPFKVKQQRCRYLGSANFGWIESACRSCLEGLDRYYNPELLKHKIINDRVAREKKFQKEIEKLSKD